MARERKFTPETEEEIAQKYISGVSIGQLKKGYATCYPVIRRILDEKKAQRPDELAIPGHIREFEKRAKSILWRQESGRDEDRKSYISWMERVKELESQDGAGYTHQQAVVQASKDHTCLSRLFREYDLGAFDPNPESHPRMKAFGNSTNGQDKVACEGIKQSYRESLRWAIETAGTYLRTGVEPETCPCDAAYYLYQQAISEPKDFLGKVGQIESKGAMESEDEKNIKKSGRRSINEIDSMLAELELEV